MTDSTRPRSNGACGRWHPAIDPDMEWWVDTPDRLTRMLDDGVRRGLVQRIDPRAVLEPGWHGIRVRRLAYRPDRSYVRTVYAALAVSAASAVFGLVWSLRIAPAWVWVSVVVALVALPACLRVRALDGHRAVCLRPRCPGCKVAL